MYTARLTCRKGERRYGECIAYKDGKKRASSMNILHMKYALEVAKAGSINKASENLLVAQPNLSRAIKELENDLGITIFERTTKGMNLTVDGEQFIRYANKISSQIGQVENFYKKGRQKKARFSISVPKSGYILSAFLQFAKRMRESKTVDIIYNETAAAQAVENILRQDYQLGVVRHSEEHSRYYKTMLEEKGLSYEPIAEVTHLLATGKDSPLAKKQEFHLSDLSSMTEIVLGDPLMPSMPVTDARKELPGDTSFRQIQVFDRASQVELVKNLPDSYMWASPMENEFLEMHGLVQRKCAEYRKPYRDILIYRKDYQLTDLDREFITELYNAKRRCLDDRD